MIVGGDGRRRRRGLGACCCGAEGLGDSDTPPAANPSHRFMRIALALGIIASAITIGKFAFSASGRKKARRARYIGYRVGRWDRGRLTRELPTESMADIVFERRR